MVKTCTVCKKSKALEEFRFQYIRETYTSRCTECERERDRKRYQKMTPEEKQLKFSKSKDKRLKVRLRLYEYLSLSSCVDCGEKRVETLDFDHGRHKHFNISQGVKNGCSWPKIFQEIQKCEVRCANCHRVKTAREMGWYSFIRKEPEEPKDR